MAPGTTPDRVMSGEQRDAHDQYDREYELHDREHVALEPDEPDHAAQRGPGSATQKKGPNRPIGRRMSLPSAARRSVTRRPNNGTHGAAAS